jgi:hypothetical protein
MRLNERNTGTDELKCALTASWTAMWPPPAGSAQPLDGQETDNTFPERVIGQLVSAGKITFGCDVRTGKMQCGGSQQTSAIA